MQLDKLSFRTPDNESISFEYLERTKAAALYDEHAMQAAFDTLQPGNGHTVYCDSLQSVFLEVLPDRSAYAFFSRADYDRYLGGESYFHSSIFVNKDSLYMSFSLRPDKVAPFLKKGATRLTDYPPFEGYSACRLEDETFLFVRERINDLYDAYWYPTKRDFEFSYQFFTD